MQARTGRRQAAVLGMAGLMLGAVATATPAAATGSGAGPAPAAASGTGARASAQAGRLILEPTERGYRGQLPVTVTNLGSAADSFALEILEPIAGSFRDAGPDAPLPPLQRPRRRPAHLRVLPVALPPAGRTPGGHAVLRGAHGTATFLVGARFFPIQDLTDADASDNTASVRLTAVETS